jgi:hypothetical protein
MALNFILKTHNNDGLNPAHLCAVLLREEMWTAFWIKTSGECSLWTTRDGKYPYELVGNKTLWESKYLLILWNRSNILNQRMKNQPILIQQKKRLKNLDNTFWI